MENIFSGVQISDFTGNATAIFSSLAPVVAFLVGLGLAFFIINFIISMLRGKTNYNGEDWPSDDDTPYEDDFDDDED